MPANARLPSGTRVEVLCGQPEQKYGVRANGTTLPLCCFSRASFADDFRDLGRRQFTGRRQHPLFALIVFADDARPPVGRPVVELLLQSPFDDGALLLDDEDLFEPLRETLRALRLQGPAHRDLVEAQPDAARLALADAEILERLPHIEIGLTGRDDAEASLRAVEDNAVEPIGAHERERCPELV